MEEELNENDLEDRMYAMLHHVDESQANVTEHSQNNDALRIVESTPNSTVRRYWRPDAGPPRRPFGFQPAKPSPYVKTNPVVIKTKPKDEEQPILVSEPTVDSFFRCNPSQTLKASIEFEDNDDDQVLELESSDDDEVIEVALPPKPTITIESSDEEITTSQISPSKKSPVAIVDRKLNGERAVSASPVPSVVSSVSDDFIRSDCIALNISSKSTDNHSFDFSLHGSDLLVQDTPSKKKRRKRNKENSTSSTSIVASSTPAKTTESIQAEECFATPRSKSSKKQKSKSKSVQEKSVSQMDIYDSDSNQSIEAMKKQTSYVVSEKSFPNIDVYESDSSQPESVSNISMLSQQKQININNQSPDSSDSDLNKDSEVQSKATKQRSTEKEYTSIVDLTDNIVAFERLPVDKTIEENFVMANVTGFNECNDFSDNNQVDTDPGQFCSTKIPAILNEDLDFDNLKGTDKFCSKRKFSAAALRAEMEKFYNESWGGENFNHRELQKRMSKDKSLWKIDPRDRMPSLQAKKKIVCQHCNRAGHRDDRCWRRVPVCHMCGAAGHGEPRCPRKMCMNCGSPSPLYTAECRGCRPWRAVTCAECGQRGHPPPHCPDRWRRYHATTELRAPSPASPGAAAALTGAGAHCSGCARRGHLVHACRRALPFTELPLYSPQVFSYAPVLPPPLLPVVAAPAEEKKLVEEVADEVEASDRDGREVEASNRDKRGRIIQDNAVSATSDAVPSTPAAAENVSVEVERLDSEAAPETDLPSNRFDLMRKLSRALESLQEDLGDPKAIHRELTYRQHRQEKLRQGKIVSPKQLAGNRVKMEGARRRLNMVLLGQAGLAGGAGRVARLRALAAALPGLRRAAVPPALRREAAALYAAVFTPRPRDDYAALLQQYYWSHKKKNKPKKKKKKNKGKPSAAAGAPPAPSTPKNPRLEAAREADAAPQQADGKPLVKKTLQKLLFVHRRLLASTIADAGRRKRRLALVRVLNSQIASLQKADKLSSKSIKKMKKTHAEAQTFLENV